MSRGGLPRCVRMSHGKSHVCSLFCLLVFVCSAYQDWHVRVVENVITDAAHEGTTDFAEASRADDDKSCVYLDGCFTDALTGGFRMDALNCAVNLK